MPQKSKTWNPSECHAGSAAASAFFGPEFVTKACVSKKPPCSRKFVLVDQNAPRKNADRALEYAHVLIGDHVRNSRALEQRLDGRNHHRIVGADKFAQRFVSVANDSLCAEYPIDPEGQSAIGKSQRACATCRLCDTRRVRRRAEAEKSCVVQTLRRSAQSPSANLGVAAFMLYRLLGRTGLRVSEIGLGCASFWGKRIFSETDAIRLVHAAAEYGVTFFDTGPSYSGGNAEPRLGRALAGLKNRSDLVIATKVGTGLGSWGGAYKDWSPAFVRASVEESLRRLRLDVIPLLQLHGPGIPDLTDGLLDTVERLKEEGKILHLSVNSFDMPVIAHVMTLPNFAAVMIDYNILRAERAAIIKELAARGIGILAGQALAGGLYARPLYGNGSVRDLWYAARAWKNHRADLARSENFRFLNEEKGWTGAEIALAWVLANPDISCAVFGTTRLPHLLSLLHTSGRMLNESLLAGIERAAKLPAAS